jgi:hypothetical protein
MAYLRTIALGLREASTSLGWTHTDIAAYLYARRAVHTHYPSVEELTLNLFAVEESRVDLE